MNQKDILKIAYQQSAIDFHCQPEDFLKTENIITFSKAHPEAKKYMVLPTYCQMISYGPNIIASIDPKIEKEICSFLDTFSNFRAFETPQVMQLNRILEPYQQSINFQSIYFLPDLKKLTPLDCAYSLKFLGPDDFKELYLPEWSNALCAKRSHLDILGIGAYDNNQLVGLAACSADAKEMWQIGIDVLPSYRHQGIAACLTSRLALAILERGKVPFYGIAWPNIASMRNALKSGFIPSWIEIGS